MKRSDVEFEPEDEPLKPRSRQGGALSRPLVPNEDVHGIRKRPSILRESLLYFAVFIPLVLFATGVIYLIIRLVR
jgi:hypothetical protein